MLLSAPDVCGEPEADWRVRVTARALPPYLPLEVEQAPATGSLAELAGMFEVLTRMVERMEWTDATRGHLTRQPETRLERWAAGALRVLELGVAYGIELSIVVAVLLLVAAHCRVYLERQRGEQHEAAVQRHAPALVDTGDNMGSGGHRLSPAGKAFPFMGRFNSLDSQWIDSLVEEQWYKQYTRELLFFTVVDLMGFVALRLRPSD